MNRTKTASFSLPLIPIFFVLFFIKIFGVADITWFWVFFPILLPLMIAGVWLLFLLFFLVLAFIFGVSR